MVTVMLGLTVTMNNALFETTQQTNAAATVSTVGEIMYTDLNQTVASQFLTSDPGKMVFKADTSMGGGQIVKITYSTTFDGTTKLYTLTRKVGSQTTTISNNLVSVQFQYVDTDGHSTTTAGEVDGIRVKLVAQVSGVTQGFSTTLNDFKVFPPNLN
jgi:methionine aminopeptidase